MMSTKNSNGHFVSKNETDVAHSFDADQFQLFLADMLLREYATKW